MVHGHGRGRSVGRAEKRSCSSLVTVRSRGDRTGLQVTDDASLLPDRLQPQRLVGPPCSPPATKSLTNSRLRMSGAVPRSARRVAQSHDVSGAGKVVGRRTLGDEAGAERAVVRRDARVHGVLGRVRVNREVVRGALRVLVCARRGQQRRQVELGQTLLRRREADVAAALSAFSPGCGFDAACTLAASRYSPAVRRASEGEGRAEGRRRKIAHDLR